MNKPRQAKLDRVVEMKDNAGMSIWVATDTAGRRFRARTKAEAVEMLINYNTPKKP